MIETEKPIMLKEVTIDNFRNYYSNGFHCENCGETTTRYILKGHKIKDQEVECENCGCTINNKF